MVGVDGKAVITHKKPDVVRGYPIRDLPTSDDFNDEFLGMQWGWNHNPDSANWSLTQCPGYLRLITGRVVANLREAPNTLTQRIFANYNQDIPTMGVTQMEAKNMKDGDVVGLVVFQEPYAYIAVKQEKGSKHILMVNNGEVISTTPMNGNMVYFRSVVSNSAKMASFEYSYNNKTFIRLGNELKMEFSLKIFTGNKFGLFNYATKEIGGYVDFNWFKMLLAR